MAFWSPVLGEIVDDGRRVLADVSEVKRVSTPAEQQKKIEHAEQL
jgi:hypothetical protein